MRLCRNRNDENRFFILWVQLLDGLWYHRGDACHNGEGTNEEEVTFRRKVALQCLNWLREVCSLFRLANQSNESVNRDDPWLKHLGLFCQWPNLWRFLEEVAVTPKKVDEERQRHDVLRDGYGSSKFYERGHPIRKSHPGNSLAKRFR